MMIDKQAVVGFVLGSVVTGGILWPSPVKEEMVVDLERKSGIRHRSQGKMVVQSYAPSAELMVVKEEIKKLYGDKRKERVAVLGAEELQQLVKSLEADGSFIDGMDYAAQGVFYEALSAMAVNDFYGMARWVQGEYEPKMADKILKDWFRSQEVMSQREAFDRLSAFVSKETLSDMAGSALTKYRTDEGLQTNDALHYIEVMLLGNGSSGSDSKFAEDFQFAKVAKAALEHIEATKVEGERGLLPSWPSNYFQEWVKRDRDGAFDFYEQHHVNGEIALPFCDYIDLVEGYIDSAPKEEAIGWISEVLEGGGLQKSEYEDLVCKLGAQQLGGIGFTESVIRASRDPDSLKAAVVGASFLGNMVNFEKGLQQFESFEAYLAVAERAILNRSPFYQSEHGLVRRMEEIKRPQYEIDRVKALVKQAREEVGR